MKIKFNFFDGEENGNINTFDEISCKIKETFKTCNLYQKNYCSEFKKDELIFELNINNNNSDTIYLIIQLKDKTNFAGL